MQNSSLPRIALNQNKPSSIIDPIKNRRSVFDLSQAHLTTIECDLVYPIFWEEIIPSDTFKIETALAGRMATPLYPLMDNLQVQYDWWYVPHRIVWDHFVNFFGERAIASDQNVQTDYLVPIIDSTSKEYAAAASTIAVGGFTHGGLFDYLLAGGDVSRPMNPTFGNYITSLLARSYMKIGYNWYIDQNYGTLFINAAGAVEATGFIPELTGDGPDNAASFQLFKKGKKKDYFTQGRPFVLNGNDGNTYLTDVLGAFIPLDTNGIAADVITDGTLVTIDSNNGGNERNWSINSANAMSMSGAAIGTNGSISFGDNTGLQLDIANLGVSINNIRLYEQIQKYYERASRSGTRYVEYTFTTYGVTPEDSRLQLPEWLGGHTERLNMTPVAQTSETGGTPLGELAAFGTLVTQAPSITKSFSEHGYIMCLATVFPDLTYQSGIDRKLRRRTPYDFHDPLWENLTEQMIFKNELRIANDSSDLQTLSYGPRYSEMKMGRRKLSGLMRSNHPQTLDAWHLAQELPTNEEMDAQFRTYDTPMDRIQAVTSQPALILYGEARITAARPMQVNPVPMLGGF